MSKVCVAFTGLILLAIATGAPTSQGIDDLGLYNPIHVWLTTGRWAYPIYYQFDGMTVHPPFRYMEIALLMYAGVPQSLAFCIMPSFFTVVAVGFLYRLDWEVEAKIAACIALISTWMFMYAWSGNSIRPDVEMTILWIAGLFALEHARLRNWPPYATAIATALLSYASVMHYVGSFALLGAGIYLLAIWKRSNFRAILPVAGYMLMGAACVLVPYILIYVIPNWQSYSYVFHTAQESLGQGTSGWAKQFELYPTMAAYVGKQFPPVFITIPTKLGIPPFVVSAFGFAIWRRSWIFGLATLPMLLFIIAQSRKWLTYLYPEYFVTVLGVTLLLMGALRLVIAVAGLSEQQMIRTALATATFIAVALICFHPGQTLNSATTKMEEPQIVEADVARAAAKLSIGNGKLVGGRLGWWYVSGGTRWYAIKDDVLFSDNTSLDLPGYLGQFDYVVDGPFMSTYAGNTPRAGVATWYGEDLLTLRGFYIGSKHSDIPYVRFARAPGPIVGHVYDSSLSEFREEATGSAAVVAAFCEANAPSLTELENKFHLERILLPAGGEVPIPAISSGQQEFVLIFSEQGDDVVKAVSVASGCGVKQIVHGTVKQLNLQAILPLSSYALNKMDFELMREPLRQKYVVEK